MLDGKKDAYIARIDSVLISLKQDLKENVAKEAPRLSLVPHRSRIQDWGTRAV